MHGVVQHERVLRVVVANDENGVRLARHPARGVLLHLPVHSLHELFAVVMDFGFGVPHEVPADRRVFHVAGEGFVKREKLRHVSAVHDVLISDRVRKVRIIVPVFINEFPDPLLNHALKNIVEDAAREFGVCGGFFAERARSVAKERQAVSDRIQPKLLVGEPIRVFRARGIFLHDIKRARRRGEKKNKDEDGKRN